MVVYLRGSDWVFGILFAGICRVILHWVFAESFLHLPAGTGYLQSHFCTCRQFSETDDGSRAPRVRDGAELRFLLSFLKTDFDFSNRNMSHIFLS